jgi:Protein of unknown function (DUF3293)
MSLDQLAAAYRTTDYWVDDAAGGPFVIRIGEVCAEVNGNWAFVTAWNPRSQPVSAEENTRRMAELEAFVRSGGWTFYHGRGVGRDGTWPPEPSLLIIGIQWRDAVELGKRFGQNAVVVGRTGEAARLEWIG